MSKYWISFIEIYVLIMFEVTEEAYVKVGKYPDYRSMDVNLPECGLRYVPLNSHSLNYSSNCYGNQYDSRIFIDYFAFRQQKRNHNISNRIYLGEIADVGEAPWTVFLHFKESGVPCTGSLITFEWILTVAHCITAEGTLRVMAGSNQPKMTDSDGEVIEANLNKIVDHPNFIEDFNKYDIVLVKLKAKFTRHKRVGHNYLINTICLPEPGVVFQSNRTIETATLFGFGVVDKSAERVPHYLRKANLTLIPKVSETSYLLRANCTGDIPANCWGDSGGPLVQYLNEENRAVQIGITKGTGPAKALCSKDIEICYFVPVSLNVDWILKGILNN